jgi:hypothetical protein
MRVEKHSTLEAIALPLAPAPDPDLHRDLGVRLVHGRRQPLRLMDLHRAFSWAGLTGILILRRSAAPFIRFRSRRLTRCPTGQRAIARCGIAKA